MIKERIDPTFGEDSKGICALDHLIRYITAVKFLDGKRLVLDAGCGCGYGSELLALNSPKVVAIDNSAEAIKHSEKFHHRSNINYVLGDLESTDLSKLGQFDLVTFFEVLEHLHKPEAALQNLREIINPDGTLLLSTPNLKCSPGGNPYHVREYTSKELEELLIQNGFKVEQILSQGFYSKRLVNFIKIILGYNSRAEVHSNTRSLLEVIPFETRIFSRLYRHGFLTENTRYFYVIAKPSS